jgi:hypothetical protein
MRRSARVVDRLGLVLLGGLAGCGGGDGGTPVPPTVCSTAGGQSVTLALAAYQSIPPVASSGCLVFPGNASTDSAQYLVVPQLATDSQGGTAAFVLDGDTLHSVAGNAARPPTRAGATDWGLRFHDFLRLEERGRFPGLRALPRPALRAPAGRLPPPTVGSTRTFSVCARLDCSVFQSVTATARTVTGHLALYVDNAAPAGGLTQTDFDSLGSQFDSRLYAIDTTAFGRESDIDGNGVVAVLLTGVVNKLVTRQQCHQSGFIAGFFFGADIDPLFTGDPRFNHGEVFYSIVADPDSTLSCSHSISQLQKLVPVTFIHEFQHMISYNQHVLVRGGDPQDTWLDEGMSHFAEELGGRSYLPLDTASFSNFVIGDLFNAYSYLDSSAFHFLAFSSGVGSLAERGGAWLFVRYLVDQYAADTTFASVAVFTRSLEESSLHGAAAIAAATSTPFATSVERWALANYVSDLPAFSAPPELKYVSWRFRTTYASLNAQRPSLFRKPFPLTPAITAGNAVTQSGTLRAGSGVYAIAFQPPLAPGFTLLFSGPNGAALPTALVPRINVIRIR